MQRIVTGLAGIALAFFLAACASTNTDTRSPQPDPVEPERLTIPEYREFLSELDVAIKNGEPRELNSTEMERYLDISSRLGVLLARYDSIDEMSETRRIELFNLQETLQATVIGKREDQLLCRRTRTVGTHFRETRCLTVSEWEQRREQAQEYMRDKFHSWMGAPPG